MDSLKIRPIPLCSIPLVQYFPNLAYLTKVLQNAVNIVKPGVHVFVGDIRSLPLLPTFASSVELFQAADGVSVRELRDRIERRIQHDRELVISPTYFLSLKHRLPKISRVEIQLRRGRADNEMTRYRYNAILYVGQGTEAVNNVAFEDWSERELTLDEVRSELQQDPNEPIGFTCIRNARIEKDLAASATLTDADATSTALELRRESEHVIRGIHPQDFFNLGAGRLGASGSSSVGRLAGLMEVTMRFLFLHGRWTENLHRRSTGRSRSLLSSCTLRTPPDKINFVVS